MRARFTDRRGGSSRPPYAAANLADHVGDDVDAVAANRAALEHDVGAPVVWMKQVHGNDVAVVGEVPAEPPCVDALVTDQPGLALGVLVADCVPVLVSDRGAGVVGVAHIGRRGLVSGIAARAVTAMCGLGARPGETQAWLGPAICGGCYELPAEMCDEVETAATGSRATTVAGRPSVDLRAGLHRQLLDVGVATVSWVGPCTAESDAHYSYRRDGVTGRFAGVIVMTCGS